MLGGIQVVPGGVILAADGRQRKHGERVADELGCYSAVAIEGLFEWEDNHHAVDALLNRAQTAALPGPELRADEPEDGNAEAFDVFGEAEVDLWEVDEDGDIRVVALDRGDQLSILRVDVRRVAEDLGEAHMGDILGTDDALEAGGGHLGAAQPRECGVGETCVQVGYELCAVVIGGGLSGGEEDARVGEDGYGYEFIAACSTASPG